MTAKPIQTLLARALYNNQSEFPTELAFQRGDVVTVLERDPVGYEGWWICSLRGKIGIAPGNRFEVLGLISKNQSGANADLYDDPKEWTITDNQTCTLVPGTQQINTTSTTYQPPTETYENLDGVKPSYRTSDLTDSGNYSNRSSDVSLSLQSVVGSGLTGVCETRAQRKTPDSQFEDYEDIDLDDNAGCKLDFDRPSRPLPAAPPHTHLIAIRRPNPSAIHHQNPVDESARCLTEPGKKNEPPRDSVRMIAGVTADELTAPTTADRILSPTCPKSRDVQILDLENLSLNSNDSLECTDDDAEILKTGFVKNQQAILTALRTRPAFVKFLSPIKQRVDVQSKRALALIRADQSGLNAPALTFSLTNLLQELRTIHQICGMLTCSSKESPDAGLTRKFVLLQKTVDDVTTRLRGIVGELDIQGAEARRSCSLQNLERLILLISQTVDSLDTTVLANAPLLFRPSNILRRNNSSSKMQNLEQKSVGEFRNLSTSFPQLNQLDNVEPNPALAKLKSRNPEQFKSFQAEIRSLLGQCQTSLTSAQQFLDGLQTSEWSPTNVRVPRTLLTTNFLTVQVKATLHQASVLIRSIADFCATLGSFQQDSSDSEANNYLHQISVELENRGSAICEALKGMVIQTKEATRHLKNEFVEENSARDAPSHLPIPAPLWQRLLGSGRGVCLALGTLHKILRSYLTPNTVPVQTKTKNSP